MKPERFPAGLGVIVHRRQWFFFPRLQINLSQLRGIRQARGDQHFPPWQWWWCHWLKIHKYINPPKSPHCCHTRSPRGVIMCNCIILWLIYFFLSFFLFKLPKFWVPDVYPSPVASCVKCPPPRDFASLYSRVQQGEIIPADIFQIRQKRQTLTRSPLGKAETWNPDHWITGASLPPSLPLSVWLSWRRAPPGGGNGQGVALTQPTFQRRGCPGPTSPLPGRGLCFGWLRGPSTPGCHTASRSWGE